MVSKYLEKKVQIISTDDSQATLDNTINLEYYLTESECNEDLLPSIGQIFRKVYGIEIVKLGQNKEIEKKAVSNLSYSKNDVLKILSTLIENTVTPTNMLFILDDLLAIS